MFEEFLVRGGDAKGAKEALAKAPGAYTAAGTYAPTADDAKFIEMMADMEEKWQVTLATKQEWLMKPDVPAVGFLTPGILEMATAAVEVQRKESGASPDETLVLGPKVDDASAAAAAKLGFNGNGTRLENVSA